MKTLEGHFDGKGKRFAIVVSRFNQFITSKLLEGAIDAFRRHGVSENDIEITWVPGAFELPLAAMVLAKQGQVHGLVCLGAVIRGATSHYDYVCSEAAKGISQVATSTGIPTGFGVLTTETIEQAIERAGTKAGNKGWETAMSTLEMANLMTAIKE